MKVDFIILGAQKCATSTLFQILAGHPATVACRVKEPHFFSTSPDWERELPRYQALFADQQGGRRFEASTSYTFYPHRNLEIWEDLFAYNPAMKFIYIVRHPVERVLSSYVHSIARGYTDKPLEQVIRKNPLLLDATRYYTQIIPYIRRFGRERVLLIDFEDLVENRRMTLHAVTDFLGLAFDGLGDFEGVHANSSRRGWKQHHWFDDPPLLLQGVRKLVPGAWQSVVRSFSPQLGEQPELPTVLRRMVINALELEISALEKLMDKDLERWRHVERRAPRFAGGYR